MFIYLNKETKIKLYVVCNVSQEFENINLQN